MKAPKNIRILLFPVGGKLDRTYAEQIEDTKFGKNKLIPELCKEAGCQTTDLLQHVIIMSADDFYDSAQKNVKPRFEQAVSNIRRRNKTHKQSYKLSDFMDEYNNQDFKGNTEKYWMTYIKF